MFEKPSLMLRIVIGKSIGFLFGLIGFIFFTRVPARGGLVAPLGDLVVVHHGRGNYRGVRGFYLSPGIQIAIPLVVSRPAYGGLDEFRADLLCL